jgi:alpha-tubulin suppressor-like RCC1 family protein
MLNMKPFLGRLGAAGVLIAGLLAFSSPAVPVQADAGESLTAGRAVAGSLSGGSTHTCLAKTSNVYCWGMNTLFQVAGSGSIISTPQLVSGLSSPVSVSAGGSQSCAVQADGLLLCWGNQAGYGFGDGSPNPNPIGAPSKIQNASGPLTNIAYVDVGGTYGGADNGCAITRTGALWCWGANLRGQVGDGTQSNRIRAVLVISENVVAVSVGPNHSCAVMQSGVVNCWGANNVGQLGDSASIVSTSFSTSPQTVAAVSGAVGISVNGNHSCALISNGTVKCWGSNSDGQLGGLTIGTDSSSFVDVAYVSNAVGIAAGSQHTCAVLSNGTVKCWGDNTTKQGGRSGDDSVTPEIVVGIANATAVSSGAGHTCALIGTNNAKCWGDGSNGILGDGVTTGPNATPVSVEKRVTQTITTSPISAKTVNDTSISLAGVATADSGAPVTYSNMTGTENVCSVSGTSISVLGAGVCKVQVDADFFGFFMKTSDILEFSIAGVAPTVVTTDATSIAVTSATLNATVNARYLSTAVSIEYGTSATLAGSTMVSGTAVTGSADTARGIAVTGLAAGTKYYFRASATNSAGSTTASAIKSFTTLGGKPSATTAIASGVSANKATLNASVNANGVSTTVKYKVGKTADLTGDITVYEGRIVADFADESVPVSITSLSELETYYYRVEAANSFGTATGEIKSFTTARPVGVTINSAAEFTNKKSVVLSVTGAAGSVSAIVSNDGGFGAAETFTLVDGSAEINWTLISSRDERLPKQVYVKFVSRFGTQSSNYQDDIILDTTAPVLSTATAVATTAPAAAVTVAAVRAPKKNGAKITVKAVDANSGIGSVEMRSGASKKATSIKYANPKAKSQTLTVNTKAKTLQVRVIDRAGNPSPWKTVKVK